MSGSTPQHLPDLSDDSIAIKSYRIDTAARPEVLVNLVGDQFDGTAVQLTPRAEALIAGTAQMAASHSSADLAEKFRALIDKCNSGSQNIEAFSRS